MSEHAETIKPCPFCGSAARIRASSGEPGDTAAVFCLDVMCPVMPFVRARRTNDAIAAWNCRSAAPAGSAEDTARLDWMEKHRPIVGMGEDGECLLAARDWLRSHLAAAATLREAIDKARSGPTNHVAPVGPT